MRSLRPLVSTSSHSLNLANPTTLSYMDIQDNLRILPQIIANLPTGGAIGAAATTVDVCGSFNINQTTAGQTITLPNPTNAASGLNASINNIGTTSFTLLGVVVSPSSFAVPQWNGSAWTIQTVRVTPTTTLVQFRGSTVAAANFTNTGTSGTLLIFTASLQNVGSAYNISTGIFTAPRTGYYRFNGQVLMGTTTMGVGTRLGIILSVNSAGFGSNNPIHCFYASVANPSTFPIPFNELKFLNAGDNVRVIGFLDNATSAAISSNVNFDFLTISEEPSAI